MEETHIAENGIARNNTTAQATNADKQANRQLLYYAHHPQFIDHRIHQLDKELAIEQLIETGGATLSLTGIVLAALSDKRWLLLSALAAGLLLVNATRRAEALTIMLQQQGYRTQKDISHERYVLRALRGDFDAIGASDDNPEERVRQIIQSLKVK
ncbi:MAG: hypothetical protein RIG62_04230 [Cyclobacteriaceae bacterium]